MRTRQTPETIAKVLSMRASGGTQMDIAEELGMNLKTVQKIGKLTSIPPVKASDPENLKKEWFGILAHRVRQSVGDGDDIKTAALIQAGAALITACRSTGTGPEDDAPAGCSPVEDAAGKPTLKDVKSIEPTVIRVPVGGRRSAVETTKEEAAQKQEKKDE